MVSKNNETVLITGVSGYLGSHVALVFLKSGEYKVRGSVRSLKNEGKIEPLKKAFGEYFEKMELVEVNLEDGVSIDKAVEGCDYVVHTASPFPMMMPKNEYDLIAPAVNGTRFVMTACLKHKVKRVCITSSLMSVQCMKPENVPNNFVFTEEHWSEPDGDHLNFYAKSKTIAEKVAWEEQQKWIERKEEHIVEVTVINPAMILGPAFVGAGFTSGQIIADTMNGKYPGVPRFSCPVVDVRDCAQAHLEAIRRPEAKNKRYILCGESVWFQQIAEILLTEFKPQGYSFSTWELKKWMATIGSWFNSDLKVMMRFWDVPTQFVNQRSKDILGIEYLPIQKTLTEMVYSMFETGALEDKRKK